MRHLSPLEIFQVPGGMRSKSCSCEPCGCCAACVGIKKEAFANKCERSFLGIAGRIPLAILQMLNEIFNPWAKPSDGLDF